MSEIDTMVFTQDLVEQDWECRMKFRPCVKRPVTVWAYQVDSDFEVETREGNVKAKAGDYLMMGIEGELYPCGAAIFGKSYSFV